MRVVTAAEDCINAMQRASLFANASVEELVELVSKARCHAYPKNNVLFYEGDPARSVYLVIDGQVKISLISEDAKEVELEIIEAGEVIGLIPLMDGGDQPATAQTTRKSYLAQFSRRDLREWYEHNEAAHQELLSQFSKRLRNAYQRIGEHALLCVRDRLFSALLEIAEREGERGAGGNGPLEFTRPTHQELADRIGSSREVVSRVLKELLESDMLQAAEGRVIRVSESMLILRGEE